MSKYIKAVRLWGLRRTLQKPVITASQMAVSAATPFAAGGGLGN